MKLWIEGYAVTGNSSTAEYLGEYDGETLMEAYLNYVKEKYGNNPPPTVDMTKPRIWGCNIYNNEEEARKYFG